VETSLRGRDCYVPVRPCVGIRFLSTSREAYRKVNHFCLDLMEYLYNPCGGRCSYAIGRPVIALEIRLTLTWVSRFSVHHQAGFVL
jgi:hypothetical protein